MYQDIIMRGHLETWSLTLFKRFYIDFPVSFFIDK